MSSIGKLMKQAQRMQQQIGEIQSALASQTVEATTGGGAVKVVPSVDETVQSIKTNPQPLNPANAKLLKKMVLTPTTQALNKQKEISNAKMAKPTVGFSMPALQ